MRRICRHLFNICWDLQNSFKHIAKRKIDISKDKSGFSLVPLYLSDEELDSFMKSYSQITEKYRNNTPTENRKLHSIGLIIAPPTMG